ncbi:TPA: hypothetical protein I7665_20895, partial [Vibrio vulnificus]|nr:hypothetical protein [Vibrio vulnificus]
KAQVLLEQQVQGLVLNAHPRIVYSTLENGSWAEDDFMQNLWAGLLASSCSRDGKDESNLILIGLLSQLTSNQAKIVTHICTVANTYKSKSGFIACDPIVLDANELLKISGINDIQQLDRELDHMRSLELIHEGFHPNHLQADVTPHALCLQLFVRAQGYVGSPIDYFGAVEKP